MSRPLSDAATAEIYPPTMPLAAINTVCEWCGIKLRAIPDAPRQIDPHGPYYHPGGCVAAARADRIGIRNRVDAMLEGAERAS